ncbi:hypothetical protein SO078_03815 [Sinorhizobium meliloti]|uniref:hypothetical protein n=1 Tax=Rhizobium meliloti TaxID=382 RepID=UPI002D77BCB4|nr:hypothetical protein [Sinorhizobium meliloti]WRQ68358.1 hypothetical protein SO078_03815 [Sinorhizobium meliloti]
MLHSKPVRPQPLVKPEREVTQPDDALPDLADETLEKAERYQGLLTPVLRPVEIHFEFMTAAATWIMALKLVSFDRSRSVLVTEIQQRRVRGAEEPFQPKDLVWLDACDKHRNEEIKQAAAGGPNLDRP